MVGFCDLLGTPAGKVQRTRSVQKNRWPWNSCRIIITINFFQELDLFFSDACDNCPKVVNPDQADDDEDTFGNVCDNNDDSDRDGIPDVNDNCVSDPNADQLDTGIIIF